MNEDQFNAPWAGMLKILSFSLTILLLLIAGAGLLATSRINPFLAYFPIPILAGCLLFIIRGYRLTPDILYINRLLWQTRIDLAGLKSAEINPEATKGSIRLFGNGGLYSISGLFRNKSLGKYRAFITDPKNSVILKFESRTIVVSPENPALFCERLKALGILNRRA